MFHHSPVQREGVPPLTCEKRRCSTTHLSKEKVFHQWPVQREGVPSLTCPKKWRCSFHYWPVQRRAGVPLLTCAKKSRYFNTDLCKEEQVFHHWQVCEQSVVLRTQPDVRPRLLEAGADVVSLDLGASARCGVYSWRVNTYYYCKFVNFSVIVL